MIIADITDGSNLQRQREAGGRERFWKGGSGVVGKESHWKLAVGHPLRKWWGAGQRKKHISPALTLDYSPPYLNRLDDSMNLGTSSPKSENPAAEDSVVCIPGSFAFGFCCVWPMLSGSPFFSRTRSRASDILGADLSYRWVSCFLFTVGKNQSRERMTRCWVPKWLTFIFPEPQLSFEDQGFNKENGRGKKKKKNNLEDIEELIAGNGKLPHSMTGLFWWVSPKDRLRTFSP